MTEGHNPSKQELIEAESRLTDEQKALGAKDRFGGNRIEYIDEAVKKDQKFDPEAMTHILRDLTKTHGEFQTLREYINTHYPEANFDENHKEDVTLWENPTQFLPPDFFTSHPEVANKLNSTEDIRSFLQIARNLRFPGETMLQVADALAKTITFRLRIPKPDAHVQRNRHYRRSEMDSMFRFSRDENVDRIRNLFWPQGYETLGPKGATKWE